MKNVKGYVLSTIVAIMALMLIALIIFSIAQQRTIDAFNAARESESVEVYESVKGELAALFERYPTDDSLTDAYPASEWVRVKGEKETPQQLVGIIYESGLAKYICYAVPATEDAPQDIKDKAFFVPVSPLTPQKGFYVLYQSAATGEHIVKQEC